MYILLSGAASFHDQLSLSVYLEPSSLGETVSQVPSVVVDATKAVEPRATSRHLSQTLGPPFERPRFQRLTRGKRARSGTCTLLLLSTFTIVLQGISV